MSSNKRVGKDRTALKHDITRRKFAGGLTALLVCSRGVCSITARSNFSFGVFSLFEPRQLVLQAMEPLLLQLDDQRWLLQSGFEIYIRQASEADFAVNLGGRTIVVSRFGAKSLSGKAGSFFLSVPPTAAHGSISRQFRGAFSLRSEIDCLQPIVSMDVQTAVNSIVGAESSAEAPSAFLMAQAVASRSFVLGAHTGHHGFDFCDTTHCQFLREPALPESRSCRATIHTDGLCLMFDGHPLAAMYSRSCSGRTNSLKELSMPALDYPYYPVVCKFCLRHPEKWERTSSELRVPLTERQRMAFNRIHGWSAIPSGSFVQNGERMEGRGIGHGIGLCQRGAAAMAREGASFNEILAHYYPNTAIATT